MADARDERRGRNQLPVTPAASAQKQVAELQHIGGAQRNSTTAWRVRDLLYVPVPVAPQIS